MAVALKIQQIIAKQGDSHTSISWGNLIEKSENLPFQVYWFNEGIYVTATTKNNAMLLGAKLLTINGFPINQVIDSLSTLITVDNEVIVKYTCSEMIRLTQVLNYFGFVNIGQTQLEIELNGGLLSKYDLKSEPFLQKNIISYHNDLNFSLKGTQSYFWDRYIEEEKIYYIKYNSCISKEFENRRLKHLNGECQIDENAPSFTEFQEKILKTIKQKKVEKLIFDMRINSGGSGSEVRRFIKELSKNEAINKKDRLFVVVGRKTFSAAINLIADFKRSTNATIIGEKTAGMPNHYGCVNRIQLPNSKLNAYYSTKYIKREKFDYKTIIPDVIIEESFTDYKNGIDSVYEWIKKR